MGLEIIVGVLPELRKYDPDGARRRREELEAVARVMAQNGLPPHREPEDAPTFSAEGYGYSGLHHLRQVAGLLWQGKPVPQGPLATDSPAETALFNAALSRVSSPWWRRLLPGAKAAFPFAHLVVHGDSAGYYVPTDFPLPLLPNNLGGPHSDIWPLGSVQRLAGELQTLRAALEIPPHMTSQDPSLLSRLDQTGPMPPAAALWAFQPAATYTALILEEACSASLQTGAAICFS